MKILVSLLLCLQFILPHSAFAQEDDIIKSTQNDIILVAAAGAGGAILGLSTLSFVDTPSKHVSNIWTGAAIGVIAGVIFVAYNSAQRGSEDLISSKSFNTSERVAWHHSQENFLTLPKNAFSAPVWGMSF